jgi:hypothetical protein
VIKTKSPVTAGTREGSVALQDGDQGVLITVLTLLRKKNDLPDMGTHTIQKSQHKKGRPTATRHTGVTLSDYHRSAKGMTFPSTSIRNIMCSPPPLQYSVHPSIVLALFLCRALPSIIFPFSIKKKQTPQDNRLYNNVCFLSL